MSTIVGAQITALTGKTGNKSIANIPPAASNVPKAVAALPGGDFACAAYQLDLGNGTPQPVGQAIKRQRISAQLAQRKEIFVILTKSEVGNSSGGA